MTIAAGSRLGPYEIIAPIGAGGMGEVYKARDARLERLVAIKVLSADVAQHERGRLRFLREAKTISALNHPHICMLFDVGPQYLVMEYCEGVTLDARLAQGPLPTEQVLRCGIEIADALDKAHRSRIIHRDLKPSNVMLTKSGVKLLDFGLAKELGEPQLDQSTETRITEAGTLVGTMQYMAPEVLRGNDADARSDIFALGLVLHEMATGKPAFTGDSRAGLIAAILEHQPAHASPPELDRLIRACLAKDPDERIQTAHDVKLQLEWIRDQISAPSGDRAAGAPRRLRPLLALGAVVLLIALGGIYLARRTTVSREPINSLAVLPFVNVSRDPDAEYLSDGVTEMLINDLSEISNLRVIPRASAFQFKGDGDFHNAAGKLHVMAVVTGRVLRRGDTLNIQAELIDVDVDRQLWGGQYQKRMADLASVQSEISRDISEHLRLRLSDEERQSVSAAPAKNAPAYEAYLKGLYLWNSRNIDNMKRSIEFFQQAIDADPRNALAYTGLADTYNVLGSHNFGVVSPIEAMPRAKAAATNALELNPKLAEAHASFAWVRAQYDWNLPAAEVEFRRAIALKPNYSIAHHWLAMILAEKREYDQAIAEIAKAHELDPLSVAINTTGIGMVYYHARRYSEAEKQELSVRDIGPNRASYEVLGFIHEAMGKPEQAISDIQEAVKISNDRMPDRAALAGAYARSGRRREAIAILNEAVAFSKEHYLAPHLIAIIYGALGERDEAFAYLNRSFEERSSAMMVLRTDARFDPLRSDPRFDDLIRRVDQGAR